MFNKGFVLPARVYVHIVHRGHAFIAPASAQTCIRTDPALLCADIPNHVA